MGQRHEERNGDEEKFGSGGSHGDGADVRMLASGSRLHGDQPEERQLLALDMTP